MVDSGVLGKTTRLSEEERLSREEKEREIEELPLMKYIYPLEFSKATL